MADRGLRKLSREELVNLIYELLKSQEVQQKKLESLQEQLLQRQDVASETSSVSEAVTSLSALFEAARKAADEYVAAARALADQQAADAGSGDVGDGEAD